MNRILPLATLLAACSPQSDAANEAMANNALPVPETPVENAANPPFAGVENAHSSAPEPAPIPAVFRGTWAESRPACTDRAHHSRLTISGRTVRHPDFVIVGDEVTASGTKIALKGHIEATGATAEAHYSLNPAGAVLTDEAGGGMIRVRCA